MANITKEQVLKINGKCSNDFVLNLRYFAYHGEKQLHKYISLGENKLLEVKLYFSERWDSVNRKKNNVPTIHFSEWIVDGQVLKSHGIGSFIDIGEPVSRKNMNIIIDLTKKYDNQKCMEMYKQNINKNIFF